jgi:hypothetical protein
MFRTLLCAFFLLVATVVVGCGGPKVGQLGSGQTAEEALQGVDSPTLADPTTDPSKVATP